METDHLLLYEDLNRLPTPLEVDANLKYLEGLNTATTTAVDAAVLDANLAKQGAELAQADADQSRLDAATSAAQALAAKTLAVSKADEAAASLDGLQGIRPDLASTAEGKGAAMLGVKLRRANAKARTQESKNADDVTVFDYMNVFEINDTQLAVPLLDHTEALDAFLLDGGGRVPAGRFVYDSAKGVGLRVGNGGRFLGEGTDYWDTYRPNPTKFQKSDAYGTHIYFKGTGQKVETAPNIANYRAPKTVAGYARPFTDFTLNDSVNGSPATPKPFSVALKAAKNAQVRNLRILPYFDGIDGYNNAALSTLGDDWDVGIWAQEANDATFNNVQVVGYWRMAAWLVTADSGSSALADTGNGERMNFVKCFGQGRRGLLIRTAPQIRVISNTSDTITIQNSTSTRVTADLQFRISGSSQVYTATGYTMSGADVQLTGITPALPGSVPLIRARNSGNGVSATMFRDCLFASLDHTSGAPSSVFGLGEAFALEADGYPLRAIAFSNTKFQTTYDRGCVLLGDIRDWKFDSACQWENGAAIAYSNTEDAGGYTENIRMDGELGGTVDITAFNPREAWLPQLHFPTQFTDGSLIMKPWRSTQAIKVKFFNDVDAIELRTDNTVRLRNGQNFQYLQSNGATNETTLYGNNVVLTGADGNNIVAFFGSSKNASFYGNVNPQTTATKGVGTSSARWLNGYINDLILKPGAVITPASNGDMQFELTSDTQLKVKVKGSDGVVRSATLTLA